MTAPKDHDLCPQVVEKTKGNRIRYKCTTHGTVLPWRQMTNTERAAHKELPAAMRAMANASTSMMKQLGQAATQAVEAMKGATVAKSLPKRKAKHTMPPAEKPAEATSNGSAPDVRKLLMDAGVGAVEAASGEAKGIARQARVNVSEAPVDPEALVSRPKPLPKRLPSELELPRRNRDYGTRGWEPIRHSDDSDFRFEVRTALFRLQDDDMLRDRLRELLGDVDLPDRDHDSASVVVEDFEPESPTSRMETVDLPDDDIEPYSAPNEFILDAAQFLKYKVSYRDLSDLRTTLVTYSKEILRAAVYRAGLGHKMTNKTTKVQMVAWLMAHLEFGTDSAGMPDELADALDKASKDKKKGRHAEAVVMLAKLWKKREDHRDTITASVMRQGAFSRDDIAEAVRKNLPGAHITTKTTKAALWDLLTSGVK